MGLTGADGELLLNKVDVCDPVIKVWLGGVVCLILCPLSSTLRQGRPAFKILIGRRPVFVLSHTVLLSHLFGP